MAPSISTEIDIAAPPSAVWSALTDYERYPDWNPFIIKVSGSKEGGLFKMLNRKKKRCLLDNINDGETVGGTLTITIKPADKGSGKHTSHVVSTFLVFFLPNKNEEEKGFGQSLIFN